MLWHGMLCHVCIICMVCGGMAWSGVHGMNEVYAMVCMYEVYGMV